VRIIGKGSGEMGPGRRSQLLLLAAVIVLAPADEVTARKLQMSGTWAMRRGQIFWPLQFAESAGGEQAMHTSQGNLSKGFGFPNGPVPGLGGVSATGSAPAPLHVPARRFAGQFSTRIAAGPVPAMVQITTMLSVDAPAAPAQLAPGSGPGSFTWCPDDPACTPVGPPQGAGARNGRVIYRAGANRFGGVMRALLGGFGTSSRRFFTSAFRMSHSGLGPVGIQPTGGSYGSVHTTSGPPVFVTQPLVIPSQQGSTIMYPGPRVTTMLGLTTTGTGATLLVRPGHHTTATGFPFTTGTVFAQQTTGSSGDDFFSVMGSDARTPRGAGNLSLVAGGLGLRTSMSGTTSYAAFGKVWMTLSPPVPSLSASGVAAATALVLLAVGWARHRRS